MTTYHFLGLANPFSSLSHLAGAIVCFCSAIPLLQSGQKIEHRVALLVFSFGCIFLLLMSGVYHLLPLQSAGRDVLQRLDHAAIFVLIAGTFTPVHAILFRGFWRWAPLLVIWLIAIAGITITSIYFTEIPEVVSTSVYLGMGWLGIISGVLIVAEQGLRFIQPLFSGAVFYSVGAVIDLTKEPTIIPGILGSHEIFHIAVLFGISYHWKFIKHVVMKHQEFGAIEAGSAAEECAPLPPLVVSS